MGLGAAHSFVLIATVMGIESDAARDETFIRKGRAVGESLEENRLGHAVRSSTFLRSSINSCSRAISRSLIGSGRST